MFKIIPRPLPIAALWILVSISMVDIGFASEIEIQLRQHSSVSVDQSVVRISDVAEVKGVGAVARKIRSLDVEEFLEMPKTRSQILEISRRQVELRVALEGIANTTVRVTGSRKVVVQRLNPASLRHFFQDEIHHRIVRDFGVPSDQLLVKITNPKVAEFERAGAMLNLVEIAPALPTSLPIGSLQIPITLMQNEVVIGTVAIQADISLFREVLMATRPIKRGDKLSTLNVRRIVRPINDAKIQYASFEQVIGQAAIQPIQPFSLIENRNVGTATAKKKEQVVKVNDIVQCKKQLREGVVFTIKRAKALQSGAVGDEIEVLNTKTGKKIYGRIARSNLVIIE